jgi:hypothetical protein
MLAKIGSMAARDALRVLVFPYEVCLITQLRTREAISLLDAAGIVECYVIAE